ncbi:hypothetical protein GWI33_007923 [Rhynchophorus ferrugineus]|uniref:Uncharacterized protein n=1 Tax=Rhynchophorus ferrugineus TaxID=354439 RepID=A0A834IJC2_RHYFE|nr:hypothetical protein GWI33_007923 [Rhynchophorus ferrugineus]
MEGQMSNCQGRVNKGMIRQRRVLGNKLIKAVCPSRIQVKVENTGEVYVQFIETHVGHDDDLYFKRLTKAEESKIREQLVAGVTSDRILTDAKTIENGTLQRINLLKRQDDITQSNIEASTISQYKSEKNILGLILGALMRHFRNIRKDDLASEKSTQGVIKEPNKRVNMSCDN